MGTKGTWKRQPQISADCEQQRWEILLGEWKPMESDPPGCPHETRLFDALPETETRLYWRPMDIAISKYDQGYLTDEDCMEIAKKMGATE